MQKVITINLNGNAYQLDQDGYEALRAYLEHAEAQLVRNPDASEILRDLEQSIAEKCQRVLGPGKAVVATAEVVQILRAIGPVENSGDAPPSPAAASETHQPKRLYQIREGAMISGVCNGIAAYLNVDPTIVRVVFVAGFAAVGLATGDEAMLVVFFYLVLMFLVPYAKTPEQLAAAQGSSTSLPYKVQHMVDLVKARLPGLHPKAH